MLQKILLILFSLTIALALIVGQGTTLAIAGEKMTMESLKSSDLRVDLRALWTDHIFWVRSVVFATTSGDTDAARIAEENVVKNAKDISGAVGSFYGKEAGDKLFSLLAGHYGAVKDYLMASIAMNKMGKDSAVDKLTRNADEIATFLSSANPANWPKETLLALLTAHGGHHIAQIDDVLTRNYKAEAEIWTAMKGHINMVADALASGIEKQFPEKFKSPECT